MGIHPERIGMIGFSAGGHLVMATATSFEQRTYEPIDEIDKISCRPDFAISVYSGYLKAKDKDEIAPGLRIPASTPPVFLAHGGDDIISSPEHGDHVPRAPAGGIPPSCASRHRHPRFRRSRRPSFATWTDSCALALRKALTPQKQP
jgi:acetyl esterase/lipase